MALNGNLGFVPLDEILRLLSRSDQKGCVAVRGEGLDGRIFVTRKGIALATTTDDRSLRQRLLNSGYVDESQLVTVERGESTFAPLAEGEPALVDLLREISVESLFQMIRNGDTFDVEEDAETPYGAPKAFDLESILADAHHRSDEWEEVSRVLPDMESVIKMIRDLGERDEVTLSRDAWSVLSVLDGGSSVRAMASKLGTTEFWTAKVAASLTESRLLDAPVAEEPAVEPPAEGAADPGESLVEESFAQGEDRGDDFDPNQSWWVEPERKAAEESGEADEGETEAPDESAESAGRLLGAYAQRRNGFDGPIFAEGDAEDVGDTLETVEEDTEAFLEKVFSELDGGEAVETEGHGLLRRRRLVGGFGDSTED